MRDSGVGIPADQLEHIFDRFHQAENQQGRAGEGTGIGLALVKQLVQLMEGQIEVESRIGQGTSFTVLLPRVEAEVPDLPEETPHPRANDDTIDPFIFFPASIYQKTPVFYDQNENVIWGNGITYSYKGWAEVGKMLKSWMEQDPEPMDPSVFYNYQISIAGNKAWATFDKKEKGGSHPISKEQRILIKKNGEWKLVTMLYFPM